jgi:hypothetical protein
MPKHEEPSGPGIGEISLIGGALLLLGIWVFYPMLSGRITESQVVSIGEQLLFIWKYRLGPLMILADVVLFALGVYCAVRAREVYPQVSVFEAPSHTHGKKRLKKDPLVLKHWANVVKRVNSGTQEGLRLSILEADALVDYFLKRNGFAGEHMADRLSVISSQEVKSLERLWQAHRLRNELAHTPGFVVSPLEGKQALLAFREFLIELGAF